MPIDTEQGIPAQITRGDAVSFEIIDGDHPASVWTTVSVHFQIPGQSVVSFTRDSVSGENHVWTLTGAETATIPVGIGTATVTFSDGTYRESSEPAGIQIFADPSATPATSFARATLTIVQSAITSLSAGINASVNINGQSFTRKNLKELMELRDSLLAEIKSEEEALQLQQGLPRKQLVTRFAVV